jgi:hypothetical protein
MTEIESLIFLLGAAALLAQLARMLNVPYPIFLVLGDSASASYRGCPRSRSPPR